MKKTCLALIIIAVFMVLSALVVPRDAFAWDVVIKDSWKEYWRLNKIHEDRYAIYYKGEWAWRWGGQSETGKAAAVLLKGDCTGSKQGNCEGGPDVDQSGNLKEIVVIRRASLVLTGFYRDGDTCYNVLYPYTAWYDDFAVYRWYGARHWTRDTQYHDNIWLDVEEGQIWIYTTIQW